MMKPPRPDEIEKAAQWLSSAPRPDGPIVPTLQEHFESLTTLEAVKAITRANEIRRAAR